MSFTYCEYQRKNLKVYNLLRGQELPIESDADEDPQLKTHKDKDEIKKSIGSDYLEPSENERSPQK